MKTNTKIQCFSDKNRNVFAKTAEKTFEFYLEATFSLGKNVIHQPVLPEKILNFTIKTGSINKFYLEGHHDFFCQIFAIWIKIIVKIFGKVFQNSNRINQLYLRRTLNWISELCSTSQCFLKTNSAICFTTYIVNQFFTTIYRIFHVTSSLQFSNPSGFWIKHRKCMQKLCSDYQF